jgi:transcription termination factor NusB
MKALQERTDTKVREIKAEIRANNEKFLPEALQGTLASRMDMNQGRIVCTQEEMKAEMDSHQKKLMAIVKVDEENIEAMMEACLQKTEATDMGQIQKK